MLGSNDDPSRPDKRITQDFIQRLEQLKDPEYNAANKVRLVNHILSISNLGSENREIIPVGGVKEFVRIATSDWPCDGDLASSCAPQDKAVHVGGNTYISLRREVIAALAEMSNYREVVEELVNHKLFDHFPTMLRHLCPRFKYWQDYPDMYGIGPGVDQGQLMLERLVCIMANVVATRMGRSPYLHDLFVNRCAPLMIAHFKNDRERALQEASTPPQRKRGLGRAPPATCPYGDKDCGCCDRTFNREFGSTLDISYTRFFANLIQTCLPHEVLRLARTPLVQQLKELPHTHQATPLHKMTEAWAAYALVRAPKWRARYEARSFRAAALRLEGNAAFSAGQLQRAVELYSRALGLCNDDVALYSNRSLCHLKLGHLRRARTDAEEALKLDPTASKVWARLGDTFTARSWHQAALLAFRQGLALQPRDPAFKARVEQAIADLKGEAPWERVPDMSLEYEEYQRWCRTQPPAMKPRSRKGKPKEVQSPGTSQMDMQRVAGCRTMNLINNCRAVKEGYVALPHIRSDPSCSFLMSWSDTPMRQKSSGLVHYMLSVQDAATAQIVCSKIVLGTPRWQHVRTALYSAMMKPISNKGSKPRKPCTVFFAYRMREMYDKCEAEMSELGVQTQLETESEAREAAIEHETHMLGLNHLGGYKDAEESGNES